MKIYVILASFLFFASLFINASYADDNLFVGVSPPNINLGALDRGTTNVVKFFVVTVSEGTILVTLQAEDGRLDFFNNNYNYALINYSEESTTGWVKFLSNPVELKPQNNTLQTGYQSIKGWREVDFLLEIPKDAEPGYHVVRITPNPSVTSTTNEPVGASIVAITSINVIFQVSGDALRQGVILDSKIGDQSKSNLRVDTYFKNTGTETITADVIQDFYDSNKSFITELSSSKQPVGPNEIKVLSNYLPTTGLSMGDYQVLTKVSYTTDSAYKNSTITLSPKVFSANMPVEGESPTFIFIVIIVIIFAVAIYRWVH